MLCHTLLTVFLKLKYFQNFQQMSYSSLISNKEETKNINFASKDILWVPEIASLSPDSIFSLIFSFLFKGIQSSTVYMIYSFMSLSSKL